MGWHTMVSPRIFWRWNNSLLSYYARPIPNHEWSFRCASTSRILQMMNYQYILWGTYKRPSTQRWKFSAQRIYLIKCTKIFGTKRLFSQKQTIPIYARGTCMSICIPHMCIVPSANRKINILQRPAQFHEENPAEKLWIILLLWM